MAERGRISGRRAVHWYKVMKGIVMIKVFQMNERFKGLGDVSPLQW